MSPRYDEVRRLADLEKKATPGPWCFVDDNIKTVEEIDIDGEGDRIVYIPYDSNDSGMICVARDTIPWLLEATACFQPGDADLLHWMRTAEGDVCDGSLEEVHDAIESLLIRLQKAAEIMEGHP